MSKKKLVIEIESEKHKQMKKLAAYEGKSIKEMFMPLIDHYLKVINSIENGKNNEINNNDPWGEIKNYPDRN